MDIGAYVRHIVLCPTFSAWFLAMPLSQDILLISISLFKDPCSPFIGATLLLPVTYLTFFTKRFIATKRVNQWRSSDTFEFPPRRSASLGSIRFFLSLKFSVSPPCCFHLSRTQTTVSMGASYLLVCHLDFLYFCHPGEENCDAMRSITYFPFFPLSEHGCILDPLFLLHSSTYSFVPRAFSTAPSQIPPLVVSCLAGGAAPSLGRCTFFKRLCSLQEKNCSSGRIVLCLFLLFHGMKN